ncbi:MAG: hypothetical protein N2317_05345 [Syntrophales bacterium]|nr:hypothetical protein [Syntrophales bacterium]
MLFSRLVGIFKKRYSKDRVMQDLPDYREKQKILYTDKGNIDLWIKYGDAFFEAGRVCDALDFYRRADYQPGLKRVMESAIQEGDVMLFQQVLDSLRREGTKEEWDRIARRAFELGKYSFSRYACMKTNNTELLSLFEVKTKTPVNSAL